MLVQKYDNTGNRKADVLYRDNRERVCRCCEFSGA